MVQGFDEFLLKKTTNLAREFQARNGSVAAKSMCTDFDYEKHTKDLERFERELAQAQSQLNEQVVAQWLLEDLQAKSSLPPAELAESVDAMMEDYADSELTFSTKLEEMFAKAELAWEESPPEVTDPR